jgi:hypothetical protein
MTSNEMSIYYYPLDRDNRATGAVASLSGPMPKSFRDKTTNYEPPGYNVFMHRGHLIANRFGGDNSRPENIVPLFPGRNMSPWDTEGHPDLLE